MTVPHDLKIEIRAARGSSGIDVRQTGEMQRKTFKLVGPSVKSLELASSVKNTESFAKSQLSPMISIYVAIHSDTCSRALIVGESRQWQAVVGADCTAAEMPRRSIVDDITLWKSIGVIKPSIWTINERTPARPSNELNSGAAGNHRRGRGRTVRVALQSFRQAGRLRPHLPSRGR
jgi:hypothetical protein